MLVPVVVLGVLSAVLYVVTPASPLCEAYDSSWGDPSFELVPPSVRCEFSEDDDPGPARVERWLAVPLVVLYGLALLASLALVGLVYWFVDGRRSDARGDDAGG